MSNCRYLVFLLRGSGKQWASGQAGCQVVWAGWVHGGGGVHARGATHLGSNVAKKTFRDRFRQIMKQACWSDDDVIAGLQEVEDIVPSAESIVKEIVWVVICVAMGVIV